MNAIEVEGLTKVFKTFERREGLKGAIRDLFDRRYTFKRAVDGVSFAIPEGEIVGYIGANGAGKSTTIKMLTGILAPTSGELRVNGRVPTADRFAHTRGIGVVFGQRTQLWWDLAVIEAFNLLKRIYEVPPGDFKARMAWFDEVLELTPLLHVPVRQLSLGQRMRCDLAASLLHNPRVVFLDEPTIGLDVAVKARIRDFIRENNRRHATTIVLTTHDLGDIEELARRVIIIDAGKVLYDGELSGVVDRLAARRMVRFAFAEPMSLAELEALVPGGEWVADDLHARCRFDRTLLTAAEVVAPVLARCRVVDLAIQEPAIEDVVRQIYEGRGHCLTDRVAAERAHG